ncbi:MAG TPA: PfkB family carbohydrate kinase [Chlamydiales bacterium]|jgi:D-beta-D-heptose 7-phosphate kinase/D-beta-D-heptose 1-phosphate adenosyltransferase|nr:PfkB family carbohydrate kinase [Chlamydiales bacterium]
MVNYIDMRPLSRAFQSIKPFKALVLGDFFVDTYTTGRVKRISPEAPVQVLEVTSQESRPGGAGNAAKNIATMGGHVIVFGRIGDDQEGWLLKAQLNQGGMDASQLIIEPGYKTPVKNRLIADSQQLLRVDVETITPLLSVLEPDILEQLRSLIPTVQVIAVSDYGKGFLTRSILSAAIQIAKKAGVPLIVDPKGTDFSKYQGATVLKPNLSEAYAAAGLSSISSLDAVGNALLQSTQVDSLLITRSEAGISLFEPGTKRRDFPVQSKEVKDVTGAGDTVLATISLALANGLDMGSATQLSNIAAGIAIERLGCVQVTLPEIAKRLLESDVGSKIFDETHRHTLAEALKRRSYNMLVLNQTQEMTNAVVRSIQQLSQNNSEELLVCLQGDNPSKEFIYLLSLLKEVDFIMLQSTSLEEFHPTAVFAIENDKLLSIDLKPRNCLRT